MAGYKIDFLGNVGGGGRRGLLRERAARRRLNIETFI